MLLPPNVVIELAVLLTPMIKDAITKIRHDKNDPNYQPTDDEMRAEFEANAQRILDEGAAWKAAHPNG
jgi:hypothetical protein